MRSKNTTFYYSQERIIIPIAGAEIESAQSGDLIMEDHNANSYLHPSDLHGQVMMLSQASCLPDIDTVRYFNMTNANYTIPAPLKVGNLLHVNILIDIYRVTYVYFQNID